MVTSFSCANWKKTIIYCFTHISVILNELAWICNVFFFFFLFFSPAPFPPPSLLSIFTLPFHLRKATVTMNWRCSSFSFSSSVFFSFFILPFFQECRASLGGWHGGTQHHLNVPFHHSWSSFLSLGDKIDCLTDTEEDHHGWDVFKEIVDTYCFIMGTFTVDRLHSLKVGSQVPHPGVGPPKADDSITYHAYYQWVPFVLFMQVGSSGCVGRRTRP